MGQAELSEVRREGAMERRAVRRVLTYLPRSRDREGASFAGVSAQLVEGLVSCHVVREPDRRRREGYCVTVKPTTQR